MKRNYKIAVLPGDGIGPEIMREGYKILRILKSKLSLNIMTQEFDVGGVAIDKYGVALPKKTLQGCRDSHAILFGSIGGPKWEDLPSHLQPERGALLPLRKYFNLFSNLRLARIYSGLEKLSPLKSRISNLGCDILCVRELTGGIYFGDPKGSKVSKSLNCAFDTEVYYQFEIERIAHMAFDLALTRRCKVTSIDKANVLESSMFWRKIVNRISTQYSQVKLSHLYVDNAAMQIIKNPSQFDVLLCSNLFGDILSDECAAITGSIGLLPSASLNDKNFGLYEPAGGSAPDIKGKNIANPIALILSIGMMMRYSFKLYDVADLIDWAVNKTLKLGYRTQDISENNKFINTSSMGDIIAEILANRIHKI
ncbi:3-isopropylmalate dehydrogenase [Buchnera aphidicola str. Bp (Baizongia pistaciae)]|uniref:3-isopropylmalate dehydrogenase n=1 Tax=Buchnera aphidicola subsp. Baizongia pistaciae (strain Bp) TaxID=224915 RepID=LEU3_BUCBP|nr:3-isopropylmalate dehydrogenase [Buchnera aphidicola]P59515.1 RecName: Full=3-isopropylmalate dehydrogenase; AltName: Full=3-IPM-DH; AltName: Full=Beta-IPM dehydrogenase; Short=IMDH [Buchnera aphidicola str. Bp (Baizongia pistaciae)]AAO27201.1 3-isopropylmalate dehydrogenase [Buchnera aphidicola str. Bp (Baizongia pistaciae)]